MKLSLCIGLAVAGVAVSQVQAQLPPPGTERIAERREVCAGEFGTGSGDYGSWVGARCFIAANSDVERTIAQICQQKSICRVEAWVRPEQGRVMITRVIRVERTQAPVAQTPTEPHAKRLSKFVDGIYAPAASGCNSRHRPADRISILLDAPDGGTVQLFAQYCAILNARGSDPSDKGLRSTLEARCGPESAEEAMRKGKSGRKTDIVISRTGEQPLAIDGVPYMRCTIAQGSTPEWWIKRHPEHQGKFPQ